MSEAIRIKGFEEAVKLVEHLPNALQKKVLVQIMKKAAMPVVMTARSMARGSSKRVAKSIKAWEPKGKTDPVVFVGPKFTRKGETDPWFAHIIEGGAKGEGRFTAKKSGWKNKATDDKKIFRFINAKRKGRQRYRSDQPGRPFMEPAVESHRERITNLFADDLNALIQKEIDKHKPNL